MRVLLDGLLPRLFPGLPFKCLPHEGRTDLEHSIRLELRAPQEPGVRFAVVRNNDGKGFRIFLGGVEAVAGELATGQDEDDT